MTEIVFPCSDNVLNEKLKEVGLGEIMPAQASVIEVSEFSCFVASFLFSWVIEYWKKKL